MIKILLKCILWYKFFNDLDVLSDFDKSFVTKKPVKQNLSYLKYALILPLKEHKKIGKESSNDIGPESFR